MGMVSNSYGADSVIEVDHMGRLTLLMRIATHNEYALLLLILNRYIKRLLTYATA